MEFYYHDVDHGVLVIAADGGLNADTAEQFTDSVEKLLDAGVHRMIIDCDQLKYISSRGVSTLLTLHRRMEKHGGDVRLARAKGVVAQAIHTLGLDRVFQIYPDVEQARLSFRSPERRGDE